MPNFIYTIIVLSGLSWFGWYRALQTTAPESIFKIVLFLALLFIALTLSLSIPLFFIFAKNSDPFTELNLVYRNAAKWAGFIALGITGILGLRAFEIADIVGLVIFGIFYLGLFLKLRVF